MIEKCSYIISSDEGTTYCALAQINTEEVTHLRSVVQVMHNARVNFGRPTIVGTGIPTDAITSRFLGGDSIANLVLDYDLTQEHVETALRYELGVNLINKC